jgi:hypothetical protein
VEFKDKFELLKERNKIRRELDDLAYQKKLLNEKKTELTKKISKLNKIKWCVECKQCMVGDGYPYCNKGYKSLPIGIDSICEI